MCLQNGQRRRGERRRRLPERVRARAGAGERASLQAQPGAAAGGAAAARAARRRKHQPATQRGKHPLRQSEDDNY